MNIQATLQFLSVAILPLLFAITLHEAAHGWMAAKLGDKTALLLGRVSLNPIRHIDPIGTVVLPLVMLFMSNFIFGWAKPVPINQRNLRHPRRDMAFVAMAGPGANALMALLWALVAKLALLGIAHTQSNVDILHSTLIFLFAAGNYGILINGVLMILNLLPIPPLDGSRVVSSIIPRKWSHYYDRIEPYGLWILIAMLLLGLLHRIIMPPISLFSQLIHQIFNIPML